MIRHCLPFAFKAPDSLAKPAGGSHGRDTGGWMSTRSMIVLEAACTHVVNHGIIRGTGIDFSIFF